MSNTTEFYRADNQLMNDSVDRIIVQIYANNKKFGYKSLMLTGCGSKSGTTTISINLAIALSMSGWKTLLVDCDIRKGTIYKRLHEGIEFGLSDYLVEKKGLKDIVYKTNYDLLEYIPSGSIKDESPIHLLCSSPMEEFVQEIYDRYDYIIYDFPSLNIVSDAEIVLPSVDGIMLIAALEQTTKKQLADAKRKVDKYIDKYYGLVINEVSISQYKKYIKDYDYFKQNNMFKRYNQMIKKKRKKENSGTDE